MSSNEVNDAAWKLHNILTEHGPLNGRQFNNLKGCFYEAFKVAMRNYPVTPDGWISCSARMPEKGENVLISVNFDSSLVEPLICSARYTGSTFRRGDATIKPGNGIEQATHWMQLPEPPQEVSQWAGLKHLQRQELRWRWRWWCIRFAAGGKALRTRLVYISRALNAQS